MNTNLVHLAQALRRGAAGPPAPQLVPVVVTADRPIAAPPAPATDTIEIELPHGARVRVGRGVKAATLRLVLDALDARPQMIAFPSSVQVWLAVGRTDMRRGMNGLAL